MWVVSRRPIDGQREREFACADGKDVRRSVERPHRRRPLQKNSQENAARRSRPIDSAGKRRSGSFFAQVQQISFRQNRTPTGKRTAGCNSLRGKKARSKKDCTQIHLLKPKSRRAILNLSCANSSYPHSSLCGCSGSAVCVLCHTRNHSSELPVSARKIDFGNSPHQRSSWDSKREELDRAEWRSLSRMGSQSVVTPNFLESRTS